MKNWMQKRWATFGAGLTMGLLVGVGMWIGSLVTSRQAEPALDFPLSQLQATATHGNESFAIATGPIAEGIEGVFFLDFLTGELQCSVLNNRFQLAGAYRHNVAADLGVVKDKNPQYLLVTGAAQFRTTGGAVRAADSVVYVLDANSGNYAAYTLPWNRNAANINITQVSDMALIGKGSARNLTIRE